MCRLFGFRSIIQSQVHSSLVAGKNSFMSWSEDHPDGWGLAYYVAGAPHIIKSESTAINDALFTKVSGKASSQTVIAHLRKATLGEVDLANTHPFQYGSWVFAHNGNIKNFDQHKEELQNLVAPEIGRFILGETDSELIFFIILSQMQKISSLHKNVTIDIMVEAVAKALKKIIAIVGPYEPLDGPPSETYLTFILSNGELMLAHQGGKSLHYSTFKTACSDRNTCASFNHICESPSETGQINHLLISSQEIPGENVWNCLQPGEIIAVDKNMMLYRPKPSKL